MKILVRIPNWIGDCIMCLPALTVLRRFYPNDQILLAGKSYLAPLFENMFADADYLPLSDVTSWRTTWKNAAQIKKKRIDRVVLFTNSFNSALLMKLAGIAQVTGYKKDMRGILLSRALKFPRNPQYHHVHFYLNLVKFHLAGEGGQVDKIDDLPRLQIATGEQTRLKEKLTSGWRIDFSRPLFGFSTSAAYGSAKEWLPENYKELFVRIKNHWPDSQLLLFGSGKEAEKISGLITQNNGIHSLAGQLSLREAIVAISLCQAFISNDSGLMHVAASLKIPLVAIFGPTIPQATGPQNPNSIILHQPVDCAPCLNRQCPVDHRCMKAISVDHVLEAFKGVLATNKHKK